MTNIVASKKVFLSPVYYSHCPRMCTTDLLCNLPLYLTILVPNSLWFWRWKHHDPLDTLVSTSNDIWHHNPEDHDLKENGVLHCNTHFPDAVFQFCVHHCTWFFCIIIGIRVWTHGLFSLTEDRENPLLGLEGSSEHKHFCRHLINHAVKGFNSQYHS